MGENNFTYGFCFLTFILTFVYITIGLLHSSIQTLDLVLFCIFIILTMLALIKSNYKSGWILSVVLLAFYMSYLVIMFVQSETTIRFLLIVINVIAFLLSIIAVAHTRESFKDNDETELLKKELAELAKERRSAEEEFSNIIEKEEVKNSNNKPKKKKANKSSKNTKNNKTNKKTSKKKK